MANPFDEFDSPVAGANPFDEFDNVNQIPGLENTVPSDVNVGNNGSFMDKAKGAVEAGAFAVAGIPATLGEAWSQLAGAEPGTVSNQFYQPRTEKGQEYAHEIGEFANRYLNPLMGGLGSVHYTGKGKKVKETSIDRVEKKQAELDAAKTAKNPFDEFDTSAVDADVAKLHDQAIIDRLKEIDADRTGKQRRGQSMFGERVRGEETMYADPQGQVFRGDPNDPNARLGLERQTEAMEASLDHPNTMKPPGEPLELLTMDNLRSANEGPHTELSNLLQEQLRQELSTRPTAHGERMNPVDFMSPEAKVRPTPKERASIGDFGRGKGMQDKSSPLARERVPFRGRGGKQAGAINPIVFKEGFEKLKKLADGTWLRAYADGRGLTVEARKDGHIIGESTFDRPRFDTDDLKSNFTASNQKGLGKEMYSFVAELGNDIQRSPTQTEAGKGMWDSFERNGIATEGRIRSPGNKQMGALRIGERKQKQIEKVIGKQDNMIPENPDPKQVIAEALAEGKDSNQWNYTESGGTLASMKRESAAILGVSRIEQNAAKRADLLIRENVFPVEDSLKDLTRAEIIDLASLMKREMLSGKRFDPEAIKQLTVKEQVAYANMKAMFDDTLRIQNEARATKGQEPITALEAYASSRWEGDFRRPLFETILDKQGNPVILPDGTLARKTVWYLADHSKKGLEKQTKALLKERPDLVFDPKTDHTVRYYKRQTDLQSVYSTMLDILGRNDEAVKALKDAIEQQTANEQASFLGQEKHFKEKTGVRGFVGDRPDTTGPVGKALKMDNKASEALGFFQQQIQYGKNAYKWSEIQKSSNEIKEILSNPELQQQQPNNVKYIREYVKNAVGHGEAKAVAHLEDAIRDLHIPFGVGQMSPTVFANALGGMKSFFILQKLGVSTGYTLANMVQTMNVTPHLVDQFAKGYRGNLLTALPVGITAGIAMATGHYVNFLGGKARTGATPDAKFWTKAFKYAEDNGVTARSIYDEAPIESSFSKIGSVGNAIGKTLSIPETLVRSMAYATYVEFFKSSGKFKNDAALFQKAEELVNASMVDYRAQERPMVFNKLGMAGDFLNTLQTFPMNWYNQWNYMGRQAAKGNIAPFATMLAVQYAIAGAMGIPGFSDMNKLYDLIKEHLPAEQYLKLKESEFFSDPKLWMIKNFGQASVYGALSDQTGIGLGSRVSSPGFTEMIQAPGGPAIDLAKQAYHAGSALLDPTNKTKLAQSAMSSTPPGLQGLVETAPFMEGTTFEKRADGNAYGRPGAVADHKATYVRTPQEETMRKFGLRSQKEVVEKEIGYRTERDTRIANEKARDIPDAFYDAVKRGDRAKAKNLYVAHVKLTGNGISDAALEAQIDANYRTTIERSSSAATSVTAMQNVKRMRDLIKSIREEAGK